MIKYHPDENMLAEYVAGSLDKALAIAVKTHICFCQECANRIKAFQLVGAAMFCPNGDTKTAADNKEKLAGDFEKLMAKIQTRAEPIAVAASSRPATSSLPPIVEKLLPQGEIPWHRVSPSLRQCNLSAGQSRYEVSLYKIRRGGKVTEHDHRGREITIVLQGAFSDESGNYEVGDFITQLPGQRHRPRASEDRDCLCFAVVEAPIKLTGLASVLNPFVRFRPT